MRSVAAFCMMVGLAASASGQRNAIDVMLSTDNGVSWSNYVSAILPQHPFTVSVGVFYERDQGFGFAGSVHNIVTQNWRPDLGDTVTLLDRADSTLHPDGRQGRFNFGAQRQAAYTTGDDEGTLRVAAAGNTQNVATGGVSVRQRTPPNSGSMFDTSNPAFGYRFDITIAPRMPNDVLVWNIGTSANRVVAFSVYQDANSMSATNLPLSSLVVDGASIQFSIPGSGSLGLAAITALMATRRRQLRQCEGASQ